MNKKNQRYTSGDGGKSLRLGELRKLDQLCFMNIRFRDIMIALKKKKNQTKNMQQSKSAQNISKFFLTL